MQNIAPYTPVALDPNTSNSYLRLSADLTSVGDRGDDEDEDDEDDVTRLPDNPERFSCCGEMLGSPGFCSGTHRWVVDVHGNSSWILGVATESVARKQLVAACPESGLWGVSLRRGEYEALESPSLRLSLPPPSSLASADYATGAGPQGLRRLQVCVAWEEGQVTFSDADSHTHLYTFTHSFTERVFPYFSTSCGLHPLRVWPARVRVEVGRPGAEKEEEEEEEEEKKEEGEEGNKGLWGVPLKPSRGGVLDYLTPPRPLKIKGPDL